jgi:PUA domain protein
MKIKERYFAKQKVVKALREELSKASPSFAKLLGDKAKVEVAKTEEGITLFLINGEPKIFEVEGRYFPTLKGALEVGVDRLYVVVDAGAVPYVVNGADIMRPGVVEYDTEIEAGDLVVVLEERHRKPIAIGKALWSGEEFREREKGKCVKNLHHVGDKIWKLEI